MRVVQVIHGFLPQFRGGTELYLLGLCRELRRLGHEVHIITGTTDNAPESHIEDYWFDEFKVKKVILSGSYLEHWTRSFYPEATRLFAEAIAEIQPDIVHIQHWYRLSRTLVETCHRMNIPAVCTLHDMWTTCPRVFRIRDESFCTRPLSGEGCAGCVPKFPWMQEEDTADAVELFKADFANEMALAHRIIVPSKAHGEAISDVVDLPREKVQVIPHGTILELQENRPENPPARRMIGKRGRLFAAKKPIRIGMWAHLFHMKGAHLVLEALQTLRDKNRFEFHVWGEVTEPNYKRRLVEAAKGLQVHWHGAFIPEDLRAVDLDLAVIPSLCSESFSFVLDEAFDLNLPAIVPKRGALGERIGGAGTTFLPENANDLARVFKVILKKPELVDAWRSAIPDVTTMAWHAREIQFIYQDVLNRLDQVELVGDLGLSWRRLEFQNDSIRRQEQMMFGYLGHIKRETGRGDHFEREMRQLMKEKEEWGASLAESSAKANDLANKVDDLEKQESVKDKIIAHLAGEVEVMRAALVAVNHPRPEIRDEAPEADGVEGHIPGIGTVADMVTNNQKILDDYAKSLRAMSQASLSKVLTLLSDEVIAFRYLLSLGVADAAEFQRTPPRIPASEVDLPGIGRLEDLVRDNEAAMASYSESARGFLQQLKEQETARDELVRAHKVELKTAGRQLEEENKSLFTRLEEQAKTIETLAREIGLFRETTILIHDSAAAAPLFDRGAPDHEADVPGLGDLVQLVHDNHEMMRSHVKRLKELQTSERDAAAVLEFLAGEILSFRALVARLFDPEERFTRQVPEVPDVDVSVPGLGSPDDIAAVDSELMDGLERGYAAQVAASAEKLEDQAQAAKDELMALRAAHEEELRSQREACEEEIRSQREACEKEIRNQAAIHDEERRDQIESFETQLSTQDEGFVEQLKAQSDAFESRMAERMKLVELLGRLIDEMRRGMTAVFGEEIHFERLELGADAPTEEHVPGLGDIATVQQVNHDLIDEVHAEVRKLRQTLVDAFPPAPEEEAGEPESQDPQG